MRSWPIRAQGGFSLGPSPLEPRRGHEDPIRAQPPDTWPPIRAWLIRAQPIKARGGPTGQSPRVPTGPSTVRPIKSPMGAQQGPAQKCPGGPLAGKGAH